MSDESVLAASEDVPSEPSARDILDPVEFDAAELEAGEPEDTGFEGAGFEPLGGGDEDGTKDALAPGYEETCQLDFVDVVLELPSTHPVVVLRELSWPFRELQIPVGGPEGVAIAYAAKHIPTPKPLTHQLFMDTLEAFALTVDVVRLTAVRGSSYFAELVVSGPTGARVIPCRPSDAIALALRAALPVPIVAVASVLDEVGTPDESEAFEAGGDLEDDATL